MAEKNNANIGFEKQIWDAACVLWGHIPAADYRKVIIGLIFLKYVSGAFEQRYNELVAEGYGMENDPDEYIAENVFFVPENARWSVIASAAHSPEIGVVIDDAMRAIEKENDRLKNVLPKIYASPDLDKRVLGEVVDLFTNINMYDQGDDKDLLGRTYEYCISQFAAYEGVKGGEFYTPSSIVKTIVAILKPFENCRVYDPCCGSGGMFVQSAQFIKHTPVLSTRCLSSDRSPMLTLGRWQKSIWRSVASMPTSAHIKQIHSMRICTSIRSSTSSWRILPSTSPIGVLNISRTMSVGNTVCHRQVTQTMRGFSI